LPFRSEAELRLFVEKAFGVFVPDVKVCHDHTTPWRAFCDAYFARSPVEVWKASRGFGGKSFLLALLGLTEAVTLKADVNVLGGSGEQSQRVLAHMQRFWNYRGAPRYLLTSDPSKRETRLTWGNQIQALMASQASARGPHPQRLRLDECDEMSLPILDAAMGQPMSTPDIPAQTVMSSTHQYPDGTMTEILKRAAEKGWPVHSWCYRETMQGWLEPSEVDRKRSEVTSVMWNVEYELQEPAPDSRAIQPEKVALMFKHELGEFEGNNRQYIETEPPIYKCLKCGLELSTDELSDDKQCPNCKQKMISAVYSTGADWARKNDWTVIPTLRTDCKPMRVVAFERTGREPWPVMVEKLEKRITRYNGKAVHDGTGLGDVVDGYLKRPVEAFIMVGRARSDLLSNYISAVERGEIASPFIRFMETEHRLASVDDVYGSGHLPDSISAMALAYYAGARHGVFFR
jgi:DNA-directed RNA polymerase subunit RPC12/RpoP